MAHRWVKNKELEWPTVGYIKTMPTALGTIVFRTMMNPRENVYWKYSVECIDSKYLKFRIISSKNERYESPERAQEASLIATRDFLEKHPLMKRINDTSEKINDYILGL